MYRIDRTGKNVERLLDMVDDKNIYPEATRENAGLMTAQQVKVLEQVAEAPGEAETGILSEEDIRMICI